MEFYNTNYPYTEIAMPLYEYNCKTCDTRFELLRPMSLADQSAPCPKCSDTANRALSIFASFSLDSNGMPASIGGGGCPCSTGGTCGSAN